MSLLRPEETINSYLVEDEKEQQILLAEKLSESFSLIQVVLGLEDALTQEDAIVRAKATKCLSDVVKSSKKLDNNEFNVLSGFFADRLSDLQSVGDAADGLRWLASKEISQKLTSPDFWEKLKAVDMLNLDLQARYKISQLLETLSRKYMCSAFADVFVALAGGEKDPQNLMLNLGTAKYILDTMGMTLPSEKRAEIYDITFCYFPVKFHPPKDMPYTITADEIKDKLLLTLSCPELAEWVVPALIAKLTAVSVIVKLSSLKTLNESLKNLAKTGQLETYWRTVWDGIKFEVLHGTPENDTYRPVIEILSQFVDIPDFIAEVKKEFEPETIPKSKLLQLAQLVIGVSSSQQIWSELAPPAVQKSLEHPVVLEWFLKSQYPIPHADQVFQALLQSIAGDHKKAGIQGLTELAKQEESKDFVPLIIQTFTQEKAYSELAELAPLHPNAIRDHALPELLSKLPETLDALSEICRVRALVNILSVRMLARLDCANHRQSLDYLQALITACGHLESPSDFIGFDRVLVLPLINKVADFGSENIGDLVLNSICILLEKVSRGIPSDAQPAYVATVTKYLGNVNFHIILSCVASMVSFPFEHDFIHSYAFPKLSVTEDILERAGYLRLVALTANKWPEELNANEWSPTAVEEQWRKVKNPVASEDERKSDLAAMEALAWATKGAILRAEKSSFDSALKFCELAIQDIMMVNLFGVIVATDRLLIKENGCTIRNLFRQRLFMMALPIISDSDVSTEILLVLSYLLKYTPQTVIASKFDSTLKMLLSSLNSEVAILQETAVESILASLPSSADTLVPHLSAMVPRLLGIATNQSSTAAARLAALKTITALKDASPEEMSSFSDVIITDLIPALGDPKRNVRKEAVKCRQAFYR